MHIKAVARKKSLGGRTCLLYLYITTFYSFARSCLGGGGGGGGGGGNHPDGQS